MNNLKKLFTVVLILTILSVDLCGQEYLPINQEIQLSVDRILVLSNSQAHTSFRPYLKEKTTGNSFKTDSLLVPGSKPINKDRSLFARKLLSENLLIIDSNNYKITFDPIIDFTVGQDAYDTSVLYTNSRGLNINAKIGKKLWINSSFIETQTRPCQYVRNYIKYYGVAPGQTTVKDFGEGAYDYGVAYGAISYSPYNYLNIQVGHGKNFIGEGYRSLLLSDNSFQYPFLKFTINYKNFQYVSMSALLQNISTNDIVWARRPWESPFIKKPAGFNYLTYSPLNNLQIGVFEGIMFRSPWGTALTWKFLNPVIFTRSIRYSLNGENNVVLGLNLKYLPVKKIMFYGQLVIDQLKLSNLGEGDYKNRTGFQAGLKFFDPFGIKNLIFLQEYNQVRPYTYSHEYSRQSYTAYNQPLAHPLRANFKESVSIIDYRYKRWHAYGQYIMAMYGSDVDEAQWGNNIFITNNSIPEYNVVNRNYIGQGKYNGISYFLLKGSYVLNPKTNMNIGLGYVYRKKSYLHNDSNLTSYYFISFATNLFNQYLDF